MCPAGDAPWAHAVFKIATGARGSWGQNPEQPQHPPPRSQPPAEIHPIAPRWARTARRGRSWCLWAGFATADTSREAPGWLHGPEPLPAGLVTGSARLSSPATDTGRDDSALSIVICTQNSALPPLARLPVRVSPLATPQRPGAEGTEQSRAAPAEEQPPAPREGTPTETFGNGLAFLPRTAWLLDVFIETKPFSCCFS